VIVTIINPPDTLVVLLPATWAEVPAPAQDFAVAPRSGMTAVVRDDAGREIGTITNTDLHHRGVHIDDDAGWSGCVAATAVVRACGDLDLAEQYLVDALLAEAALARALRHARRSHLVPHRTPLLDAAAAAAWMQHGSAYILAEPPVDTNDLIHNGREVWTGTRWFAGQSL
jgi:hypothetical protein